MKTKILVVILLHGMILGSCTSIRMLSNQKIISKTNCSELSFEGKIPLIPITIEGLNKKFIFDTGATISMVSDSTMIKGFSDKEFGTFGAAKGADEKKIRNKMLPVSINSNLFESKNKVLTFINLPASKCEKVTKKQAGIIGLDLFFDKDLTLQMDFSNSKICNISEQQLQQLLLDKDKQYKLIKSKCKTNQIFIYLTIEGKEHKFLVDTGYTGNILFPYNDKLKFKNSDKIELEGSLYKSISSFSNGTEVFYQNMPIKFAGENVESKITVSSSIKAQNIGIEFIKGFDWLIDYNNNKIYVKRNQNKIENTFNRKVTYYSKAIHEKLKIVVKEKSQTQYHLGDEVISVNGQKVTGENNCELQDLLNKTADWNSLQLQVVSGSP